MISRTIATIQDIFSDRPRTIDGFFFNKLDPLSVTDFTSFSKSLPSYRFVDLFRAIEHVANAAPTSDRIESAHPNTSLTDLILGHGYNANVLKISPSEKTAWPTGPKQEVFLPTDVCWVLHDSETTKRAVRIYENSYMGTTTVEVASNEAPTAETTLKEIVAHSEAHSIYRNALIRLSFESGTRDEYGDIEKSEFLRLSFMTDEPVSRDDLIIDEATGKVLQRNVIDLFARRETLRSHSIPVKRGVLLYGPPGTGKTYTCRFLASEIKDATRIFVTGTALNQVGAIFSTARMLQPSIVFLEDVDLAFTSRDINLMNSGLADLLDNLDGVRSQDDICVVMTTNSIDRMEAAIKDRPGRISQCIYMGAPSRGIRKRYLKRYLTDFGDEELDLDHLAEISDGVSQAFLKEWIYRAAQIASEAPDSKDKSDKALKANGKLPLRNEHFDEALEEMKSFIEGAGAKIVGFSLARQHN